MSRLANSSRKLSGFQIPNFNSYQKLSVVQIPQYWNREIATACKQASRRRQASKLTFGSHTYSVPTYLRTLVPILFFALTLTSCVQDVSRQTAAEALLSELQQTYAPDKRVARFHLELERDGEDYVLKGQSTEPAAMAILKDSLQGMGIQYKDSVQHLPSPELGADTLGVVRLSVANLRSNPGHSEELATQATMGTVVKVLMKQGGWHLVQTPDGYIAWADSGALEHMNAEELKDWKGKEKLVYTEAYGRSKIEAKENAEPVSDLVVGDIMAYLGEENGFYKIGYPDGREAFVSREEALPYDTWMEVMNTTENTLVDTAHELMGLPYLWGGTSAKGVDCSGFTKTVYFLNGIVLPRDASQQVFSGELVDEEGDFSKLHPGDLLFFGRYREDGSEKVTHVGMWIGNNEFIHSSGDVHISSMDPEAENYDEFNKNRYFRAKRILGNLTDDVRKVEDVY